MKLPSFHARMTMGKSLVCADTNGRLWSRFLDESPSREDIINLLVVLEELCQFHADETKPLLIDYTIVRQLSRDDRIHASFRRNFLSAALFMKLPKDENGRVSITTLLSVITRTLTSQTLFASLGTFSVGDASSESIMSIDALEDWLFQQSSRLVQIRKLTEQFLPLWVFTAAHTIAFFHGRQKPTRVAVPVPGSSRMSNLSTVVKIREFVSSETMKWLLKLSKLFDDDIESNPFSRIHAVRYYDSFTVFDAGRTGAASNTDQCCIFAGGYMNPVFVESLMSCYGGYPMDYRRFLTFAVAWDNRKTPAGVRYFWPVLDRAKKGYITREDVQEQVDGIVNLLRCLPAACGPQGPHAISILVDEIIDIFRSYDSVSPEKGLVSLAQAVASPSAFGTIVGILANTQAFIEYECREDTAHKQFVAKQMKESKTARLKSTESTRAGQLALLQQAVDDCWFPKVEEEKSKFDSFAEFLDFHEATYGGESMEPWLTKYYQWEQEETERQMLHLVVDVAPRE